MPQHNETFDHLTVNSFNTYNMHQWQELRIDYSIFFFH